MFANQRGNTGLGSIVTVGLIMALSVLGTGLMVKVYRDGGAPSTLEQNGRCHVVCGSAPVRGNG